MSVDRENHSDISLKDRCVNDLKHSLHRPYVYALALAGLSFVGCTIGRSDQSPTKVATTPTVEPTPKMKIVPTPTPGYQSDAWTEWRRWLRGAVLRYQSLQGPISQKDGDPFYRSRGEFLATLEGSDKLPLSMVFINQDEQTMQVAKDGAAFIDDAFSIFYRGWRLVGADLCAQPSKIRTETYRKLAEDFEYNKYVDRNLIERLVGGATLDCSYFSGPGRVPRPEPTWDGIPRG